MRSILKEFAYGNISPIAHPVNKDSELGQANALVVRLESKLLAMLNTEEKELLEKLIDAQLEVHQLAAVQHLLYGYRLGLIMTAEAFVTREELVIGA